MNWYYYLHELYGGCLTNNKLAQFLAKIYCFIFGHSVPCGTGGGLCERCEIHMALLQNKDGTFNVNGGISNPLAFSLRDIYDVFYCWAKYKIWVV